MSRLDQRKLKGYYIEPCEYRAARAQIERLSYLEEQISIIEAESERITNPKRIDDMVDMQRKVDLIYEALEQYVPFEDYREPVLRHIAGREQLLPLEDEFYISTSTISRWSHMFVWGWIQLNHEDWEVLKDNVGVSADYYKRR